MDREQYLLGKAIDKTFEKIATNEQSQSQLSAPPKNHVEHECIPFSIRNLKNKNSTFEGQVDIARKLLEDPLVAIRKREVESRTQLLQNPVKLKEISMLLKAEQVYFYSNMYFIVMFIFNYLLTVIFLNYFSKIIRKRRKKRKAKNTRKIKLTWKEKLSKS